MAETYAEAEAECLAQLEADRLARMAKLPKAEVVEFPAKLAEAERVRQIMVEEQDRQRRIAYQALCDATWQRNLDQWAAERRRSSPYCHRGVGDPDF